LVIPALARAAEPVAPDLIGDVGGGRVFSDKPGGPVIARRGRKTIKLRDGEQVSYRDDNGMMGIEEMSSARVLARGKLVSVANPRVITEDRLARSPDRKWAVFSAMLQCGDFCHLEGWVLGGGLRVHVSDNLGPDPVVAWRPDGKQVAIGSRGLYLISLPDGKVTVVDRFTSPAYAPDGRLFVRDLGEVDPVWELPPVGPPRKVLAMKGKPQPDPDGDKDEPPPVTIADGKLTAVFERGEFGADRSQRSVALAEIGKSSPEPERSPEVERTITAVLDPGTPPARAAHLAGAQGQATPAFAHDLAVAANTRGYRLYQEGKLDEALPLFMAAMGLDVGYGMPRYNAARVYARKGNAREAAVYLNMLRIMGKPQQQRLQQAARDEAFKAVAGAPELRALLGDQK
jgi:hypothetical protein